MSKFRGGLVGAIAAGLLSLSANVLGANNYVWTDPWRVKVSCDLKSAEGDVLTNAVDVSMEQGIDNIAVSVLPRDMGENSSCIQLDGKRSSVTIAHPGLNLGDGGLVEYKRTEDRTKYVVKGKGTTNSLSEELVSPERLEDILPGFGEIARRERPEEQFSISRVETSFKNEGVGMNIKEESIDQIRGTVRGIAEQLDVLRVELNVVNSPVQRSKWSGDSSFFIADDGNIYCSYDGKNYSIGGGEVQDRLKNIPLRKKIEDSNRERLGWYRHYQFVFSTDSGSIAREPLVGVLAKPSFLIGGKEYTTPEILFRMQLDKKATVSEYKDDNVAFIRHPNTEVLDFVGREFVWGNPKGYPHSIPVERSCINGEWVRYWNVLMDGVKDRGVRGIEYVNFGQLEGIIEQKNLVVLRDLTNGRRALYVREGETINDSWGTIKPGEGILDIPPEFIGSVSDVVRLNQLSPLVVRSKSSVGAVLSRNMRPGNDIPEFWIASDVKYEAAAERRKDENLGEIPVRQLALGIMMNGYRASPADFWFFMDDDYYKATKGRGLEIQTISYPIFHTFMETQVSNYQNKQLLSPRKTNIPGIYSIPFKDYGSFHDVEIIGSKSSNGMLVGGKDTSLGFSEVISYCVWPKLLPSAAAEEILGR